MKRLVSKSLLVSLLILLLVPACSRRTDKSASVSEFRTFPVLEIPAMIGDPAMKLEYMSEHWWDAFLSGNGRTDSAHVLGVSLEEVEQNVSAYCSIMHLQPVPAAQKHIAKFFSDITKSCLRDSATCRANYETLTSLVDKYLYDPNSPLRSEDLYLPFVKVLVESGLTSAEKKRAYRFQLEKCSLNPYGSQVPDFEITDIRGRKHRLSGVKADHIMLFFSNPGCHSCQEIIDMLGSRAYIDPMIASGKLAVVNVYIDEDLDLWKSHEAEYPRNWLNGYDSKGLINGGELYYVRAIPSLYLLDGERRVIMKDAPVERVLEYMDNVVSNQ